MGYGICTAGILLALDTVGYVMTANDHDTRIRYYVGLTRQWIIGYIICMHVMEMDQSISLASWGLFVLGFSL